MRLRNLIVLLGSMVAIGLAVIFILRTRKREAIRKDAEVTFSRLATCFVGGDARGKRFEPSLADAAAREAIDPRGTDWPKRCRQYVDDAIRAHDKAYTSGVFPVDAPLSTIAESLDRGEVPPPAPLDELAPLWTMVPSEVPQPRAPLAPAAIGALPTLHPVMATAALAEVDVLGAAVHITLMGTNDRDPPRVACELDPKLEGMTCALPPPAPIFSVLARDHAAPPLYVKRDDEGRAVVIDGAATEIVRLPSFGYGFAYADGRIAVMSSDAEGTGDRLVLTREASGAVTSRSVSGVAARFRSAGSWVLWKEVGEDHTAAAKIFAFDISSSGPPVDLGAVERRADGGTSSGDCRTESHVFVDLSPALAIHDPDKGWSVVEETPRPQYATRAMACRGDTLQIVDTTNKSVIVQRCTRAGCEKKEADVAIDPRAFVASMVGDDVLLAWVKDRSVYAMRAPIAGLPDAAITELVHGDVALDFVRGSSGLGLGSIASPPVPSAIATPEGLVLFLQGAGAPTLHGVVVPVKGAPHALTSH